MAHTIIGIIAGTLTTIAFLPQVIKIYRMKDASELSMTTFSIFSLGVLFWLVYGILVHELPIILANSITLLLIISIIAMKLKFKHRP